MYVEKLKVLFVCRYLLRRVRGRESDLILFPGGELQHVETERLKIECIHAVCGANYRRYSKIPTSNCMRGTTSGVSITGTPKSIWTLTCFHFQAFHSGYLQPLFVQDGSQISEIRKRFIIRKLKTDNYNLNSISQ